MRRLWIQSIALLALATIVIVPQGVSETPALRAERPLGPSKPVGVKPPTGNFYSYAPSIVEQGNTRHVFYCGNKTSGQVHDHVMLSVGTKSGGTWTYGAPRVAFGPNASLGWANYHTCDPQVLRGAYNLDGHVYPWAIFFTAYGCQVQTAPCPADKEVPNQLGVAFSDSLDAPASGWKFLPNPLISYAMEYGAKCPAGHYCLGQPAATSIDGAGKLLLFYQGANGFVRREVNLTNVNSPVIGASLPLPTDGLPAWLHNASVVFSLAQGRFYIAYDGGLWNKDLTGPPVQTDTVIASIEGGSIWSGTGTWRHEDTITPAHSGHAFNHNPGIVQTPYGAPVSEAIEVFHTVANGWTPNGEWGVWTYRLWTNTY